MCVYMFLLLCLIRWWHVPTLPSLTWRKSCPASSPSNLLSWMVKHTHTHTFSHTHNNLLLSQSMCRHSVWERPYYFSSTFAFPLLAPICFPMGFLFSCHTLLTKSVTHGAGDGLLLPYCSRIFSMTIMRVCALHTRRVWHADGKKGLCKFNISN